MSFHAVAAERGDGMHPLLLEALSKSGSVSGPPAPSEQNNGNVVRLDFGATDKSPKNEAAFQR